MAKKIKIKSIQYENEDGHLHLAVVSPKKNTTAVVNLSGTCTNGETACVGGVKYICMPDPFGDCVWWKTTEACI
jgi:hypothetical protein